MFILEALEENLFPSLPLRASRGHLYDLACGSFFSLPSYQRRVQFSHCIILISFFFFFWLSCLFYRNPWCYIGPTQVIQYNLPILRPADEQSSFPLPFKITPCLSGFVFSFQGLGCGRQHISLPTTPTSTDFSGVPWLALKKENYHLLTMQSIFPYGHG